MTKVIYQKRDVEVRATAITGGIEFWVTTRGFTYGFYEGKLHRPWWKRFRVLTVEEAKRKAIAHVDRMCASWDRDDLLRSEAEEVLENL